jgi:uncharacterized repeat protein (TIGR01451 family)
MALLGFLLAAAFAPGAQARVDGFQALAPSSVPLTAVATDPGSGLVYAQENEGTSFFAYDPRTNVWSELAPSPVNSENNGGATYLGGKIYVSYTENENEVAVYDIASNSWSTIKNPLEAGTADITAGNGKLYMTVDEKFVEYDPATGVTMPLAEPPEFTPAECHEGFEPWGGLQFDGSKIYGHQGDGCNGFAVYDIATNSWSELPLVPEVEEEGAVAGSAIDPVTNTYIAYGPYDGNTLYRYDIEAGSWSTSTLPFEVDDGGMAYVALPGYEGVYMIQGEGGTEFTRYTEHNMTDLSPSMSAGVVASATGGEITYSIQVKNNGPERAGGVVLSDPLPAGTKLVSAGASQGACAGTSTLACSLGALRSGASASLTIKVAAGFGKVTNTATVSSQAIDSNPANDSATVVSTVARCVVPKLRGLRLKGAKKALRAAHCKPGKVTHRYSRKVKKGRVVRGGRHRGTALPAGSKVKLSVSRGAKHKRHHLSKGSH